MTVVPGFTSADHPTLRRWRRWAADARAARDDGIVVLEGAHLVESWRDATAAPWVTDRVEPRAVVVQRHAAQAGRLAPLGALLDDAIELPDAHFARLSATTGNNAVMAFVPRPVAVTTVPENAAGFEVWLDGVQDPGNVGAIARSAAAFGASRVRLGPGCADPWSARCLRAGMGGQFHVEVVEVDNLASAARQFDGMVVGLDGTAEDVFMAVSEESRVAWVFGSEGAGLSPEVRSAVTRRVRIAMTGSVESLNVAAAAAIVCHASARRSPRGRG